MTESKSVIFTADDFGASPEVNAGILRAHREGVLRGTSLMVAAPARDAAAAAARDCPELDVGLHLVVCKGRSVLDPGRLGGLVDAAGRFIDNPVVGGMRYFFDRNLRAKLADECRAQIELHLKLIGYLNHIDGHLNFHVHPVLCDILLGLATEYRVPCIRLPREPVFTTLGVARDHAPRKLVEAVIFRTLSRRARRRMTARGIKSNDWLFGLHQSGNLTEHYVLDVIARLRPGVTEIYTHPAAHLGATLPPEPARREVAILTSPLIPLALEGAGARLTDFAELAGTARRSA
ncbi:MAG TPA: hopanoid biosynthesis-associated protein HpnK [Candidatus Binataceae bacterium]|nr:hopanoid biosynthesis-associated protein HpnK [Candidatus Binataceae bacterium]